MRQKIKQKAVEIRNKRLGKDVREAMASGVELSGETAADALDMSEATKADWLKKSKDGSFVPKDKWTGTKLGFVYPDGSESIPVDLKGEPGSIENATAKEIATANGSNVETELASLKNSQSDVSAINRLLSSNFQLSSSGSENRVLIPFAINPTDGDMGTKLVLKSNGVIEVLADGFIQISVNLVLHPNSDDTDTLAGYHIYRNESITNSVYHSPVMSKYTTVGLSSATPVRKGDKIMVRAAADSNIPFKTKIHRVSSINCLFYPTIK